MASRNMRLQLIVQHVKPDHKLLKPQVERRRRERINRCLETLRKMLMQERENQKRTEKTEILEHTVAFLKGNSSYGNSSHHNNFHNGFSTCLQRASEFLQTTVLDTNQKVTLSSRLDMVGVHYHHHHHLRSDLHVPLSPSIVSKQPSPKSSALKAAVWSHRSADGHLTCQISSQKADINGIITAEISAGLSKSPLLPQSTVSPSHRCQLTSDCQIQPPTQAYSPITTGSTQIGKVCHPRQLLPSTQPMWRPWP